MKLTDRLAGLLLAAALLVACGSSTPDTTQNSAPTPVAESEPNTSEPSSGPAAPDGDASEEAGATAADVPTLSENAVTTESGLQYEDLQIGDGGVAGFNSWVTLDYSIYLEDGTVVDSSYWYDQSYGFLLGAEQVIAGWEEGIAGMMPGGIRRLVVSPELAYGAEGTEAIPPNSTLIYDIEVLTVLQNPAPTLVDQFKQTESGIRYAILQEGEGEAAEMGDIVVMDYDAWLDNGIMFYRSGKYDYSAQLTLGESSIAGLNEGMVGMKEGEVRQLKIPAEMAYGDQGKEGYVPPNSGIIIEVMLHDDIKLPEQTSIKEDKLKSTDSGLQYAVFKKGDGTKAKTGDVLSVNYNGWLEDGKLFDTSLLYEGPFIFTLGQSEVIAGWDEGLVGMKVGEKRQLRIPSALAYGEAGYYDMVPANANLVFDVELVDVQSK